MVTETDRQYTTAEYTEVKWTVVKSNEFCALNELIFESWMDDLYQQSKEQKYT